MIGVSICTITIGLAYWLNQKKLELDSILVQRFDFVLMERRATLQEKMRWNELVPSLTREETFVISGKPEIVGAFKLACKNRDFAVRYGDVTLDAYYNQQMIVTLTGLEKNQGNQNSLFY